MPRRNDIAKIVLGVAALSASPQICAKEVVVKLLFCVLGEGGKWSVQRFKPLIDPRAKTTFSELSFADKMLLEVRQRRFFRDSEVTFDYKFDAEGRLNALQGRVKVVDSWEGEANLFPNADGTVPPYHVLYSLRNRRVQKPEDAAVYIGLLDEAPIYRTTQSAPCAAMISEAVRMNAAQE